MSRQTHLKVLVIDDEEAIRAVLRERLRGWEMEARLAADAEEARTLLAGFAPDVAISDVMLPDASGVEMLEQLKSARPGLPVVMITAHGTVDLAVAAMKAGAHDFLTKPLDYDRLREVLESAVSGPRGVPSEAATGAVPLEAEAEEALARAKEEGRFGSLVGASEPMLEVYRLLAECAPTDVPVLITGESGTGKELAARTIHGLSPRHDGPLIPVNAAAIPRELMESEIFGHEKGAFTGAVEARKGCFELAHGGTLFIDELAEMPVELQPKLLRVLEDGRARRVGGGEERRFDVRLVTATNRAPEAAIEEGRLRQDLYYRVGVFRVEMPPLRSRPDDIAALVDEFVTTFNQSYGTEVTGVSDEALARMREYSWPGNVRELRNAVQRALVIAKRGEIELEHLPPSLREGNGRSGGNGDRLEIAVGVSVAEAEKELILRTLEAVGHNKTEAARQLGLDVKTVRNKLKAYAAEETAGREDDRPSADPS